MEEDEESMYSLPADGSFTLRTPKHRDQTEQGSLHSSSSFGGTGGGDEKEQKKEQGTIKNNATHHDSLQHLSTRGVMPSSSSEAPQQLASSSQPKTKTKKTATTMPTTTIAATTLPPRQQLQGGGGWNPTPCTTPPQTATLVASSPEENACCFTNNNNHDLGAHDHHRDPDFESMGIAADYYDTELATLEERIQELFVQRRRRRKWEKEQERIRKQFMAGGSASASGVSGQNNRNDDGEDHDDAFDEATDMLAAVEAKIGEVLFEAGIHDPEAAGAGAGPTTGYDYYPPSASVQDIDSVAGRSWPGSFAAPSAEGGGSARTSPGLVPDVGNPHHHQRQQQQQQQQHYYGSSHSSLTGGVDPSWSPIRPPAAASSSFSSAPQQHQPRLLSATIGYQAAHVASSSSLLHASGPLHACNMDNDVDEELEKMIKARARMKQSMLVTASGIMPASPQGKNYKHPTRRGGAKMPQQQQQQNTQQSVSNHHPSNTSISMHGFNSNNNSIIRNARPDNFNSSIALRLTPSSPQVLTSNPSIILGPPSNLLAFVRKRAAIPQPSPHKLKETILTLLFYFGAPLTCLFLGLLVYSRAPVNICGFGCPCDLGESAVFAFTYVLLLEAPRCFLFACLQECLLQVAEQRGNLEHTVVPFGTLGHIPDEVAVVLQKGATMAEMVKNGRVWALAAGAALLSIGVRGVVAALALPAVGWEVPTYAVVTGLPFLIYTTAMGHTLLCFTPLWLQWLPLLFSLVIPQYQRAQYTPFVIGTPVFVAVVERLLFYVLHLGVPEWVPDDQKLLITHISTFYAHALVAIMALALEVTSPTNAVLYFLLVVAVECFLATHWLDRALLAMKNWMVLKCSQYEQGGNDLEAKNDDEQQQQPQERGMGNTNGQQQRFPHLEDTTTTTAAAAGGGGGGNIARGREEQEEEEPRPLPPAPATERPSSSLSPQHQRTGPDEEDRPPQPPPSPPPPSTAEQPPPFAPSTFGESDIRLIGAYSRQVSFALALLAVAPVLVLGQVPLKVRTTDCAGHLHLSETSTGNLWAKWGVVVGGWGLAFLLTTLHRLVTSAMLRPLVVQSVGWQLLCALYMVTTIFSAFSIL